MAGYEVRLASYLEVKAKDAKELKDIIDRTKGHATKVMVRNSEFVQEDPVRDLAADILDQFSEVLAQYGIYIPDEERQGDEDESTIYGDTYWKLEEEITEMLLERLW